MNNPTKAYSLTFNSDGVSETCEFDLSLIPQGDEFRGNLPSAVVTPQVTFTQPVVGQNSPVSGVTAQLVGTKVTLTFPSALAKFDSNEVLVVYTATFALQFSE